MILEIEGMHCDACVRRVAEALAKPGAGTIQAVRLGEAEVAAPPEAAAVLLAELDKAGFPARVRQ